MFFTHHLPNQLQIVAEHQSQARSQALGFFVKTGARDEDCARESGVSHFLEHMLFKGTETRSARQLNHDFDALGARYNAFTSQEETVYYGSVLPSAQEQFTAIFGDMMRPALRDSDFEIEKKVILEEIAMYRDRPMSRAWELARQKFYGSHPLGQSILGTCQSIENLKASQMRDYFERRYAANNLVFVLVGNFDWELAKAQIETLCADWKSFAVERVTAPLSAGNGIFLESTGEFARQHLAFLGVGFSAQDERHLAASIACEIIGDGENSRLYWALIHSGLAQGASLGHNAQDGAGAFSGAIVCAPENSQKCLDIFRTELQKAAREGVSDAELERARARYASGIALQSETPMGRFRGVGMGWMYRRELLSPAQTLEKLMAVSRDEVNAILKCEPLANPLLAGIGPQDSLT